MAWPLGVSKTTPRGRAWDATYQPPVRRRSVEVMFQGQLVESWERGETCNSAAIDAVVDHLRTKVKLGAAEPGRYRFVLVGTKDYREIRLSGPGRRTAE